MIRSKIYLFLFHDKIFTIILDFLNKMTHSLQNLSIILLNLVIIEYTFIH